MILLVWLWNPWKQYATTRHNVWVMALEAFIVRHSFPSLQPKSQFQGALSKGTIEGNEVLCLFPVTYMNKSWSSIASLAHYFKIPTKKILVVHDELDIAFGAIRSKIWWSAWGHNGIKSTEQSLWTQEFWRLRIWIDRPLAKEQVVEYVLQEFSSEQKKLLPDILSNATEKMRDFCIQEAL
jgi:peptidyl-tRNA hydrolase, PTH1 family